MRTLPMRRLLLAATVACLALPELARADFVDGFLAECTAVGTGTCTEASGGGYARQPISFGDPKFGVSNQSMRYTFGQLFSATIAGRAVYDAPTGGNLLFVIPLATPISVGGTSPDMKGESGGLAITLPALAAYVTGKAFNGAYAATTTMGTSRADGSTVTSGAALYLSRGVLQAQSTYTTP